jgi:hypothetical protein
VRIFGFVGNKRGKGDVAESMLLRALNGRIPLPAVNVLLTGKADGIGDERAPIARLAFTQALRSLVNAWIDSAKKDKEEQPWKRTFSPLFLQDYINRNPPVLEIAEDGPRLVLFPHVWDKRKGFPLFADVAVESILSDLDPRDFPSAQFVREIIPFAFDAATAMFLQLLDSPESTKLFRCDGCGAYFIRTRAPKKDMPIYHGSWCANCKARGSAKRTDESRETRTKQKVEWAADIWPLWKPDRRHGNRAEWVAHQVNKQLKASKGRVARNWVTLHQDDIEAELKRRKHATR